MSATPTTSPVNRELMRNLHAGGAPGENTSPYEALVYTVFQRMREATETGIVIAVTAVNTGAGVTYTVDGLASWLARDLSFRTLRVDSQVLRQANIRPVDLAHTSTSLPSNLFALDEDRISLFQTDQRFSWEGSWNYRRDCIEQLRHKFDYVVIDCPSLSQSTDVLSLAPFVDGIILIIEAGKTRKGQVSQAERSIEDARGNLIGHVLNKRTYIIPDWLYNIL